MCTFFAFPNYTGAACNWFYVCLYLHPRFVFNGPHNPTVTIESTNCHFPWIQPWYASAAPSPYASSMDSWELQFIYFLASTCKIKLTLCPLFLKQKNDRCSAIKSVKSVWQVEFILVGFYVNAWDSISKLPEWFWSLSLML